jgi:hypothetical protein
VNVRIIKNLTGHNGAIYKLIQHPEEGKIVSAGGDGWIVE